MENAAVHPASASPSPAAHKVVIVEDDPAIRRSLQLLLRAHGHDVRTYPNGLDLLADSNASDAACLISDYRLEGLDGITLLSRLRAEGWRCPAILVTAFPSSAVAISAREAGFTAVFEKPLRRHALVDAIARLTAGADMSERRPPPP